MMVTQTSPVTECPAIGRTVSVRGLLLVGGRGTAEMQNTKEVGDVGARSSSRLFIIRKVISVILLSYADYL